MEKLEKQIKKKKERWKNKIHHKHEETPVIMDPEQAWAEYDEDYFEDVS